MEFVAVLNGGLAVHYLSRREEDKKDGGLSIMSFRMAWRCLLVAICSPVRTSSEFIQSFSPFHFFH